MAHVRAWLDELNGSPWYCQFDRHESVTMMVAVVVVMASQPSRCRGFQQGLACLGLIFCGCQSWVSAQRTTHMSEHALSVMGWIGDPFM